MLQGDYEQARKLLHESLALARQLNYRLAIALALWHMGDLEYVQGEYRRAVVLLRAFQELLDSLGIVLDEVDRGPFEGKMAELQAIINEADLPQEVSVGKSEAVLQRVIAYALGEMESI
jgi:hypothetical protein